MEDFLRFVCEHAHYAPWILFFLLLLTGINIPISEDFLIMSGGALVSTCIPEHFFLMYVIVLLGAYFSAWEAYWIGRLLGPQLGKIRLFKPILDRQLLDKLAYYYSKFGILTFIVVRFCPGGIRNALFLSSGLTKMPFALFILRDCIAAAISVSVFFFLGHKFGEHSDIILHYFKQYTEIFIAIVLAAFLVSLAVYWKFWHTKKNK